MEENQESSEFLSVHLESFVELNRKIGCQTQLFR